MKAFICDSCNRVIKNPYKEKVREYTASYTPHSVGGAWFNFKKTIKVDLCEECYSALHLVAIKKVKEEG